MVTGYLESYPQVLQEQLRVLDSASALVSTVTTQPAVSWFPNSPRVESLGGKSLYGSLRVKVMRASPGIDFQLSFRMLGYFMGVHLGAIEYVGDRAWNTYGSQKTTFDGIPLAPSCYLFI